MTKSLTETVRSTTTIPAVHTSPKQTVVTTIVLTTLVSTVTADQPSSSPCVDKTITSTTTMTKFVTKPAEPSQSLVMISQLSDGQINGPPVTAHGPLDPSSLDFLHSTTKPTPSPSAFIDPLQSWLVTGHPQPSVGFPHHGPYKNSTTCTESTTHHDGTETRNPDAPIPFPTQSFLNVTSLLEHGHGPKPGHQPTLSV
ncbi:hypothetical protein PRZ48_004207 [Zasmidium cellare]|uniref:Uncharacterized protein n=1 Tax=Zasmidium cellare TaxID=395010 RepID=A0ABR0EXK9_ZASCE|nr:hypothetical protein PRZ48_004207 [Zasmidium cellare]